MPVLTDGFSTTISFQDDSSVQVEVKEIAPPGLEGGGGIDITTMSNSAYRTMAPKSLKTVTEVTAQVAYDPATYNEMITMINANQLITVTFPNGDTIAFWGFIDSFIPQRNVEGEQPVADLTIVPTNRNDSDVETAPVLVEA